MESLDIMLISIVILGLVSLVAVYYFDRSLSEEKTK